MSRFVRDDFDEMAEFGREARSGLAKPGNPVPPSEWSQLAKGKTLGKSVIVRYDVPLLSQLRAQFAPVNLLEVSGSDDNALQLSLLLSPPKVMPTAGLTIPGNIQDVSGPFQDDIELNPTRFPFIAPTFSYVPVTAQVEWGIGGVSNKVDVDFVNGTVLNLTASFVRVQAGVDVSGFAVGFWGATSPALYQLSAFVGPGLPRESARRTVPVASALADATDSDMLPIPRFAKNMTVIGHGAVGAAFVGVINFFLGPANNYGRATVQANLADAWPIPGGAEYFSIRNISGSPMTIFAIFELAI